MNIFVLDEDPRQSAQYHCDRHVIKMILESAQILCTAAIARGFDAPYKPTHAKHPCVIWAGESFSNFRWLFVLGLALEAEHKFRWGEDRHHRSGDVIRALAHVEFEDIGRTPFVQAMPEQYRVPGDAVMAYRQYYNAEKASFARWTRRPAPPWFNPAL
ncbi:MAG TPA: hypothetical protein ENN07_01945 [candidate division Zixibacteria bacterium]|nr:hypothetical protein [candidate division Zixibacteria bacterium]